MHREQLDLNTQRSEQKKPIFIPLADLSKNKEMEVMRKPSDTNLKVDLKSTRQVKTLKRFKMRCLGNSESRLRALADTHFQCDLGIPEVVSERLSHFSKYVK